MKVIRYWTSHPDKAPTTWMANFELNGSRFDLVYDEESPEYLIASEHIYTNIDAWRCFLFYYRMAKIKIMYSGECVFPDMNLFDYATSFDRDLSLGGRVVRRPCVSFFKNHIFRPMDIGCPDPMRQLKMKSGFCNFIYSNPKAHPRRDELFYALSSYKKVDSLGGHLNNCNCSSSRNDSNWRQLAVEMKSRYKFSIASENACYVGYVSEKIISSFQAYTVPIYWGDPGVEEEFNPKAFINANKYSDSELIDIVRSLDENDDLYLDMLAQPPMTRDQKDNADKNIAAYREFWDEVFSGDVASTARAPIGTWTDMYIDSIYKRTLFLSRDRLSWVDRGLYKFYKKLHKYFKRRII